MPSTVVTSLSTASMPSIKQDNIALPSMSTAQVPHSPSSQPCLVPVRPASSRKTSSSVLLISVATSRLSPLMCRRRGIFVGLPLALFFWLRFHLFRKLEGWNAGVLECWARNASIQYSNTPLLRSDSEESSCLE